MKTFEFNYTGDIQTLKIPNYVKKIYIELYGCGDKNRGGGKVVGYYNIKKDERELFIYCGGQPYNGGGMSRCGAGYGSTDIRLVKASEGSWYDTSHSSWDTDKSLLSRIAVAGGAGGSSGWNSGAHGGGLIANNGNGSNCGTGGTQTSGGRGGYDSGYGPGYPGHFGTADRSGRGFGPGGGGWYGGGSGGGAYCNDGGGGGGSSYIDLLYGDVINEIGVNKGTGKAIISYSEILFYFYIQNNMYGEVDNKLEIIDKIEDKKGIDLDNIKEYKLSKKFKIRKILLDD